MIGKREHVITHINNLRIVSSTPPLIGLRQKLTLSLNFLARRTTGSHLRLSSPAPCTRLDVMERNHYLLRGRIPTS